MLYTIKISGHISEKAEMPCWDEYRPTGLLGAFRGDAGNKPYWHSPHLPSLCMVAWTVKPPIPISQPPSAVQYYFYLTQDTDPRGILRSFSFHWSSIEHHHWASQKCPSIQSLSSIAFLLYFCISPSWLPFSWSISPRLLAFSTYPKVDHRTHYPSVTFLALKKSHSKILS